MVTAAKLTEAGLKKQIGRLRGFGNWEALREELLRCLWSCAESDDHAQRAVTRLIDAKTPNESGFTSCPTPAEIIATCKATPAVKKPAARANKRCPECFGTGFAQDFILATRNGDRLDTEPITEEQYRELRKQPLSSKNQAVYEAVHPCACVQPAQEAVNV
jgi:hypothetical protein